MVKEPGFNFIFGAVTPLLDYKDIEPSIDNLYESDVVPFLMVGRQNFPAIDMFNQLLNITNTNGKKMCGVILGIKYVDPIMC